MNFYTYSVECLVCGGGLIIPFMVKHRKREKITKEIMGHKCPHCDSTPAWLDLGWTKYKVIKNDNTNSSNNV